MVMPSCEIDGQHFFCTFPGDKFITSCFQIICVSVAEGIHPAVLKKEHEMRKVHLNPDVDWIMRLFEGLDLLSFSKCV